MFSNNIQACVPPLSDPLTQRSAQRSGSLPARHSNTEGKKLSPAGEPCLLGVYCNVRIEI